MCREELNFQSYSDHLKALHPEEDPRDRREFGQAKLFGGVMVKKVTTETTETTAETSQEVQEHDKSIEDAACPSPSNEEVDVSMDESVGPVDISDEYEEILGKDEEQEVIVNEEEEVSMVEIKKSQRHNPEHS